LVNATFITTIAPVDDDAAPAYVAVDASRPAATLTRRLIATPDPDEDGPPEIGELLVETNYPCSGLRAISIPEPLAASQRQRNTMANFEAAPFDLKFVE
jgi:hypothetical protein